MIILNYTIYYNIYIIILNYTIYYNIYMIILNYIIYYNIYNILLYIYWSILSSIIYYSPISWGLWQSTFNKPVKSDVEGRGHCSCEAAFLSVAPETPGSHLLWSHEKGALAGDLSRKFLVVLVGMRMTQSFHYNHYTAWFIGISLLDY